MQLKQYVSQEFNTTMLKCMLTNTHYYPLRQTVPWVWLCDTGCQVGVAEGGEWVAVGCRVGGRVVSSRPYLHVHHGQRSER